MPEFRRRGLAAEIIRTLAHDRRFFVNSPADTLQRCLARVAQLLPGDDEGVVEVTFHAAESGKLK